MSDFFKVPEEKINFHSFIKFSLFLFRAIFLELNPLKENSTLREKFVYFARDFGFKMVLLTYGLTIASYTTYVIVNRDNFEDASGSIPNIVAVVLLGCKTITTSYCRENLLEIFQELSLIMDSSSRDLKIYKRKPYLDAYHRTVLIYSGAFASASLSAFTEIIPFILNGTTHLPVKFWYPFDMHQKEFFPLAWLWVNWVGTTCLLGLLASDTLLYGLITVIAMEFDFLKRDIMELDFGKYQDEDNKSFKSLIERHKKLFEIGEKLQKIYSFAFFLVYVISSIVSSFAVFKLLTVTDKSSFAFYICFMSIISAQVLLFCFYGQKLIDASESISDAVYNCGWENLDDNKKKKQYGLMIMRSQKALRLTAMNFVDVSLESSTLVIFIYS